MSALNEIMDLCKEIVRIRRHRDAQKPHSDAFYEDCVLLFGKHPLLAHLCDKHGESHYDASELIDWMCAGPKRREELLERARLDDVAFRR